jgi:hypothetical protein
MARLQLLLLAVACCMPSLVQAQRGAAPRETGTLICESGDKRERFCPADTRGGVVLVRTLGGRCVLGRTWGYESEGIWVRGCAGEFQLEGRAAAPLGSRADTLTCASDDYRYTLCAADTRGGVRLVNQLSRADCFEGRTWGYDRRGVWVDEGCAAEFELAARDVAPGLIDGPADGQLGSTFVCESRDGRRRLCAVDLGGHGASVIRNISTEPCEEGRNWGYAARGLWVDYGCRAEFRIVARDGSHGVAGGNRELTTIICESRGFQRRLCAIERANAVRLTRQLSDANCIEGETWGYDRRAIWVDRGCAAEFTLYD